MSAELLREAASLMRERAEAATPGPWTPTYINKEAVPHPHAIDRWYIMGCFDGNPRNPTGSSAICEYEADAAHVAGMDPIVALAVAAWLDVVAETPAFRAFEEGRAGSHVGKNIRAALVVATAYLGRSS